MSSPGSNADQPLPAIDERIVAPGSRFECDDGKLVYVPPADPPHAICNANLAWLLRAHVVPELEVAVDMLTRTSRIDDIAPDASVYPRLPHPETGGRQLEWLAFEIASTQSLADAGRKAGKLIGRGVRRVFAIDLERTRVLEWSGTLGTWSMLDSGTSIEDHAFVLPIPIEALLHVTRADDAVAHALLARHQPVIVAEIQTARTLGHERGREQGRQEGREQGREQGRQEGREQGHRSGRTAGMVAAVLGVLAARGFVIDDATRARIERERDPERLEHLIARAAVCTTVGDLTG
ncbi:MAG: Uma2 family endonuclease [Kofleriaceae bacterium]